MWNVINICHSPANPQREYYCEKCLSKIVGVEKMFRCYCVRHSWLKCCVYVMLTFYKGASLKQIPLINVVFVTSQLVLFFQIKWAWGCSNKVLLNPSWCEHCTRIKMIFVTCWLLMTFHHVSWLSYWVYMLVFISSSRREIKQNYKCLN